MSSVLILSLRANGSRKCAPDDRLRETIHVAAKLKSGLLRRFAPRNDVEYDSAISRRDAPELCKTVSLDHRGRRECRVPAAK